MSFLKVGGENMMERRNGMMGPPTPRILQLPRRHGVRRNAAKGKKTTTSPKKDERVKLEVLFHQERSFHHDHEEEEGGRRRGKVADGREIRSRSLSSSSPVDEAKWRFQAEMLRSECNLLRVEKEIAMKKMERRRKRMERTLRSAVLTLLSGKQRISEGKKESKALEDEISHLIEKLNELKSPKVKDMEGGNYYRHNFDRQASVLRRELEKFDAEGEVCVERIQKMAEASFLVNPNTLADQNIDTLSSKMEALSKGVFVQAHEEQKGCSRHHCKAVMRKIADQVRAEAEQWSQMQEMLGQVRNEMEELQTCRDFWQNRALESDSQIQNLHSSVERWRQKALSSEAKLRNLEAEVCKLQEEMKRLRKEDKVEAENNKLPTESEKRVLICRLKENRHSSNGDWSKYSEGKTTKPSCSKPPLREIKNGSVSARQRSSSVMRM